MTAFKDRFMEYPGIELQYDAKANAFLRQIVKGDLDRIASVPLGRDLLAQIASARPVARTGMNGGEQTRGITFDPGINVVLVPILMEYVQSGYKKVFAQSGTMDRTLAPSNDPRHNLADRGFTPGDGCKAMALDVAAASDQTGSVSVVLYTGAQTFTRGNEDTYSFIALAHELIHSLHHLTGRHAGEDEEKWTVGLPPFAAEPQSENRFRQAFGLPARVAH